MAIADVKELTTPEVHYRNGRAVKVVHYCLVNGTTLANSDYELNRDGEFTESHFDEHHGIYNRNVVVPRSKFGDHDRHNPNGISLLTVLGANQETVEAHLRERGIKAKHLNHTSDAKYSRPNILG